MLKILCDVCDRDLTPIRSRSYDRVVPSSFKIEYTPHQSQHTSHHAMFDYREDAHLCSLTCVEKWAKKEEE